MDRRVAATDDVIDPFEWLDGAPLRFGRSDGRDRPPLLTSALT